MCMYEEQKVILDKPLPIKVIQFHYTNEQYLYAKRVDMHWHTDIELILPIKGKLFYSINGKSGILNEGQVLIINSEDVHRTEWTMIMDEYIGYCVQMDYGFVKKYYKEIEGVRFYNTLNDNENRMIKSIIKSIIYAKNEKKENYDLFVVSQLLLMLYYMLVNSEKNKTGKEKDNVQKGRLRHILAYIHINYAQQIDPDIIANEFGISTGYLHRLFRESIGVSPKKYLIDYRLQIAAEQLINTNDSIVDVAFTNGFNNMNSFYKLFNSKYQMTPKQYRLGKKNTE